MVFAADSAKFLLIVHAVLGAATVAVMTHLALWVGKRRWKGARRFATMGAALYLAQFALGNVIYPAYKWNVRVKHFDSPVSIAAEQRARVEADDFAARIHLHQKAPPAPAPQLTPSLTWVGRLFDIKEHWAALGLPMAVGAALLAWTRKEDTPFGHRLYLGCAIGAALCAWLAAIVGLYVTSIRSL